MIHPGIELGSSMPFCGLMVQTLWDLLTGRGSAASVEVDVSDEVDATSIRDAK